MNLELRDIRKAYGAHVVLDGFSHVFPEGRVTAILGPSGCGKTTLLRLVAGLEAPDAGTILGVPAGGLSMMFQEDRLPPQLDAADCLRCVLKRTADRETRIRDALNALGLGDAGGQPVREFSGGMRRRVALARALLFPSPLALLDEPFKGLDEDTRRQVMDTVLARTKGKTLLMVTHDPEEAAYLGGRVVRM